MGDGRKRPFREGDLKGPPAKAGEITAQTLEEKLRQALATGERTIVISNDAEEALVRGIVESAFPGESGPLRTNPRIGLTTYSRAAGEVLFAKRDVYSLVVLASDPEPISAAADLDF